MTRYYHNENPQVAYWMGKCALLQQELDILAEKHEDLIKYTKFNNERVEAARELAELVDKMRVEFNALPWYKKMFFKFKI